MDGFRYYWFSLLLFLIPTRRETKVRWFRKTYTNFMNDKSLPLSGDNLPSIVAHSFGTYILGYALLKYENIRFDRVILCGSILPQEFPWDGILNRGQVTAVLNEFGTNDIWSTIVHWFIAGTGASGNQGFSCSHPLLVQKRFQFDHSEYFDSGHMKENWISFISEKKAALPRSNLEVHRPRPNRPWGLYGVYLIIVTLATFFSPWTHLTWPPPHSQGTGLTIDTQEWMSPLAAIDKFVPSDLVKDWHEQERQLRELPPEIDKIVAEINAKATLLAPPELKSLGDKESLRDKEATLRAEYESAKQRTPIAKNRAIDNLISQLQLGTLIARGFPLPVSATGNPVIIEKERWQFLNFAPGEEKLNKIGGGMTTYVGVEVGKSIRR